MEQAPPPERVLARATRDRVVAGVAAGLAAPLGVDVAVVRLGLLLLVPIGGAGLIVYAAGWAFLPAATEPVEDTPPAGEDDPAPAIAGPTGQGAAAAGLLLVAELLVLRALGLGTSPLLVPLLLVVVAVFLLWWRAAAVEAEVAAEPDADGDEAPAPARAGWSTKRWLLFGAAGLALVFGLLAVAGVVAAGRMADAAGPSALAATGTGVLLTRPGSRTRRIAFYGLLLAGAGTARAIWAVPFDGGSGPLTLRPAVVAEVEPIYRHRMGTLELDLSGVTDPDGRTVTASVSVGELVVVLPDAPVDLHTRVGLGWSDVLGDARRGYAVTADVQAPGGASLVLDLDVGSGSLRVVDAAYRSAP